jgi:endonuclease/exonuclease/phosphatase family metal-dependent hydrolase
MKLVLILSLIFISCSEFAQAETHKRIIKVLSFNIRGFHWPASKDKGRYKRIGEIIRKKQPDFVLLQEAFINKSVRKINKEAKFKNVIKGPGWKFGKLVGSGLYIFTNHPVQMYRNDGLDFCEIGECLSRKSIIGIRSQISGMPSPIQIINTHLQAQTEYDSIRMNQVEKRVLPFLNEDMSYQSYLNIFGGDFNFKPKHDSYWLFRNLSPFKDMGEYCINNQTACSIVLGKHPSITMTNVYKNTNDRQFVYNPTNSGYAIKPVKLLISMAEHFEGGLRDDRLSDHWGYEVHYDISWNE